MSRERLGVALGHLGKLLQTHATANLADGQLVQRFAAEREEAAFAVLVERFGPMVLGVCRRLLQHSQDAEDAFQATFLVLARQAGSLRRPDAVGAWLYEVAYHIAARSRRDRARRQRLAEPHEAGVAADPATGALRTELAAIVDEELRRLPAKYRLPLVLCYCSDQTYSQAAKTLGWPPGTVSGRLARAREMLRQRLTRRGLALSASAFAAILAADASATVPPALASSTVRIAILCLEGSAAASGIAAKVAALSEGMVRSMFVTKMKMIGAAVVVAGILIATGSALMPDNLSARAAAPLQAHAAQGSNNRPVELALKQAAETLDDKARAAIIKGRDYLKQNQRDGNWEQTVLGVGGNAGGVTCLVLFALLESGVKPDDELITKSMAYVRSIEPKETYVVALQTAVLARVDVKKDKDLLQRNVDWLLNATVRDKQGRLEGWSYPVRGQMPDNSNTQYAVFALYEAANAGAKVPEQTWKDIRDFYLRTQLPNGGWPYRNHEGFGGDDRLTMTCAGVSGLHIASRQLNEKNGPAKEPLEKAMQRVVEKFTVTANVGEGWKYYNLYGLARVGRLASVSEFSTKDLKIDWYRAGAEHLVRTQFPEGCWRANNSIDGNPVIATSFALLFLSSPPAPPKAK